MIIFSKTHIQDHLLASERNRVQKVCFKLLQYSNILKKCQGFSRKYIVITSINKMLKHKFVKISFLLMPFPRPKKWYDRIFT